MTLQPRFVVRAAAALSVAGLLATPLLGDRPVVTSRTSGGARIGNAATPQAITNLARLEREREREREREGLRGAGPRELPGRSEPVGRERVVVPAMPRPVAAANGSVYIPRALAQIPFFEEPGPVADDNAVEMNDGLRAIPARGALPSRATSVSANVRANDTSGDPAGSTQSETTIAALGNNLAAGWNDGKNFSVSPGGTGYAYSTNGGLSWTDGGVLPAPNASSIHEGDPVLSNDNAGNFYFADLYTPDNDVTSAIAVCRGAFSPNLTWNMPVIVASSVADFLDKPWIAADKVGGNVYCTYTRFLAAGGNQIDFSRSINNGATWSAPTALTSPLVESVQGSRVAVGPSGEIQVIYFVYDQASSNNYMRARRSTNGGITWGPEITLPTGPSGIISNYGSGPAGFNRAGGIGFPSLAIDGTGGANNGRVYATWEETVNFYYDPLGTLGAVNEVENNGTSGTANPIVIGQTATGTMSSTADQDWFSFNGAAGQTVILYLVPGTGDGFLRLYAGGGGTPNRAMLSYIGFGTGLIVYTLPYTGTFYFRVLANSGTVGTYQVYTGFNGPDPGDVAGRDTRDAIIQSSPDGVAWDARRVVNDDPPVYDNAFPEVAVDAAGQVFVDWYDHRGDPLGINTDIYYARSSNGSVTFLPSIKVNDGPPVNWNNVASNLAPNMGDYSNLVADGCNVYANFADGRQGTPDSWVATINDCATPTLISLVQAQAQPDHVDLGWFAAGGNVSATVFRREANGDWIALGDIESDGQSRLSFRDATVRAGARYDYRVGVLGSRGMEFYGEVWVDVPLGSELSIQRVTNPVVGDLTVTFTLPRNDPATIQLIDVSGRALETARVTASGQARLSGRGLTSGVYWVKLTQAGRSVQARTVFIR